MVKIGDIIIFRYNEGPHSQTTPNEWYDFKDEVDYLYSGNYDYKTWRNIFNQKGIVKKITHNIITAHVDGIGEVEGSVKIIKILHRQKPTFRIKQNLEYDKI